MPVVVDTCPVEGCDQEVARCDNGVLLDFPAVAYSDKACWTIMKLPTMSLACVGNPPINGLGHTLHVHQPEETT